MTLVLMAAGAATWFTAWLGWDLAGVLRRRGLGEKVTGARRRLGASVLGHLRSAAR